MEKRIVKLLRNGYGAKSLLDAPCTGATALHQEGHLD
jgi:hypothetical protein